MLQELLILFDIHPTTHAHTPNASAHMQMHVRTMHARETQMYAPHIYTRTHAHTHTHTHIVLSIAKDVNARWIYNLFIYINLFLLSFLFLLLSLLLLLSFLSLLLLLSFLSLLLLLSFLFLFSFFKGERKKKKLEATRTSSKCTVSFLISILTLIRSHRRLLAN